MARSAIQESRMNTKWQRIGSLIAITFREKWENLGAIIGAAVSVRQLSPLSAWLMSLFGVALAVDLVLYVRRTWRELREKHVPLLVVVGPDEDELAHMERLVGQAMAPHGFDSRKWDVEYNIEYKDLTLWRKSYLPAQGPQWANMARQFAKLISKLNNHPTLKGRKIYHVFIYGPAALAVGLGAVVGTNTTLVLYHYDSNLDRYIPVLDFTRTGPEDGETGPRSVKVPARRPFRYVRPQQQQPFSERLFVTLHLSSASHDPCQETEALAATENASAAHIRNTYDGFLSFEADWLRVAREVVTILTEWLRDPAVREIELVLNAPLPLAFAVGMAFGKLSAITVRNWLPPDRKYYPVLKLNELG
jgi:hypothetical protein